MLSPYGLKIYFGAHKYRLLDMVLLSTHNMCYSIFTSIPFYPGDVTLVEIMPFVMHCHLMCFSLIHILITDTSAGPSEPKTLEMLGFLPMTGKGWIGGGACLPATLMALRHVNERQGLLNGYNLSYSWVDTQVIFFIH